jgi:UDPglucose 6-dehydrogenase
MEAVPNASALLVVTEWREFRSPDFAVLRDQMRQPFIVDGRNLYDPATMAEWGFDHVGVGRGAAVRALADAQA